MQWDVNLEPFQADFVYSQKRYPAFVGGWASGKSLCGILKGLMLSQKYDNNLGLIVRKNFTDLRDSTLKDFTKYTGLKVPSSKDVKLPNGSEIMFRHMDELAGIVQNVNLGWFFIEQAEEFDTDEEFQKLRGRLRRNVELQQGFIIANTKGHNWIYRLWKNGSDEKYPLFEATAFDNAANLPDEFLEDLKTMKEQSPSHYRRYVLNSWEDVDTSDRVIPYVHLTRAINKELYPFQRPARVVACDPAEFGDDKTVIYAFEGTKIVDREILTKKEPMETAGRILRMSRNTGASLIGIDEIGIGAGIRSRLSELGANVIGIHAGENADDTEHFKNRRAELWWNAKDMFREDIVSLPDDDNLLEDLAAVGYLINSKGQVQIEKKKEIKKKLGRSPDLGDAFVIGLWLLGKVEVSEEYDNFDDEFGTAKSYSIKSHIA